jgi:replicative DNA helicase Mcm
VFSVDLGKILEDMKMIHTSFHKQIPNEILRSPNVIIKEFLKAYYDCEAHVSRDGIAVVSASRTLLEQVSILLLRFGIISQLHKTYSRATNAPGHKRTKYERLIICGENAKKYVELIGFRSTAKIKATKKIPKKSNTNIDVIPNLRKLLKEIRIGLGLSQFKCGIPRSTFQHYERGDRNPSYDKLKKIVEAFGKIKATDNDIEEKKIVLEKLRCMIFKLAAHTISLQIL